MWDKQINITGIFEKKLMIAYPMVDKNYYLNETIGAESFRGGIFFEEQVAYFIMSIFSRTFQIVPVPWTVLYKTRTYSYGTSLA